MSVRLRDTDDETLVRQVFHSLFAEHSTLEHVRAAEPLGHDPDLWSRLAANGAPGMRVPGPAGGGGATLAVLTIVAEEAGRALAPVPLLEHLVAAAAVADADAVAFRDVIDGDALATLALRPSRDGVWRAVPAGSIADVIVGIDGADAVAIRREPGAGALRNGASQPLADVPTGARVVTGLGPAAVLDAATDAWRVLVAAALVGAAEAALEIGLRYVMDRSQFGRPIGSFQAVQHGLADLPGLIEGSRLLAGKAAWALDRDECGVADLNRNEITDGHVLAAMAFLFAAEAAARTLDRVLHYHGAIGCTLEGDVQLYYRRVRAWPLLIGSRQRERRRLADLLLGPA